MNLYPKSLNLWVSLPRNDVELAQAALEAGAAALKVHITADHIASGTRLGTQEEEGEMIAQLIAAAKDKPVGIVPGASLEALPGDLEVLRDLGLSFVSVYAHHLPAGWLRPRPLLPIAAAPSFQFPRELIPALSRTGVAMIEAAVMPRERYGQPVTAQDLAVYHYLRRQPGLPIIVPTQLKWAPEDVPALAATGVNALMTGAVVTGHTSASLHKATERFRKANDAR